MADRLSYMLPLDSLDINYLGGHLKSWNEKPHLLWSKAALEGESKYYEIEIIVEDDTDISFVPTDTYTCHICNINVPAMYAEQHNKSKKHENYKQIFKKVFERMSNVMNMDINNNVKPNTRFDEYYCDTCCKIVSLDDLKKHKRTNYHKKSKENDKLAEEFINMFTKHVTDTNFDVENTNIASQNPNQFTRRDNHFNVEHYYTKDEDDDDNDDNIEISTTNYVSDDSKNRIEINDRILNGISDCSVNTDVFHDTITIAAQALCETKDDADDFETSDVIDDELTKINKVKRKRCRKKKTSNENPNNIEDVIVPRPREAIIKEDFQRILKDYIQEHGLNIKLPIIEGDFVIVESEKGDRMTILLDNFNSCRHFGDRIYCQMCRTYVSDTDTHNVTNTHVGNILKPIDEEFARNVDNISNHCLVCNDVVLTMSQHHKLNEHHKRILNKQIVKQEKKKTNGVSKTYCIDCNVYIDTHNYLGHSQSKKHKEKKIKPVSETSKEQAITKFQQNRLETITKLLVQKKVVYKINDQYNCTSCKIDITDNLIGHVSLPNHLADILEEIEDTTKPGFCNICEAIVPKNGMLIHNLGKPHRKIINEIKEDVLSAHKVLKEAAEKPPLQTRNKVQTISVSSYAKICNSGATITPSTSLNNSKSFPITINQNIIQFGKNTLRCRICHVLFPDTVSSLNDHLINQTHYKQNILFQFHKVNTVNSSDYCGYCSSPIIDPLTHIDSKAHLLKLVASNIVNVINLRFYIYNKPNDTEAFVYKRFYHKWLLLNNIAPTKITDLTQFTCHKCNVHISKVNEIEHSFTEKHITYLKM